MEASTGSGAAGAPAGAVACPVCTLYLREGISLQKHLDTHPKEQVIEALIKASSSGSSSSSSSQQLSQVLSSQSTSGQQQQQQQQQQPPPTTTPPQINQNMPYPLGPVYAECPPLNAAMIPPQFASFSYQQFVNNGTMMIPQYAMAAPPPPQPNQMMQMLYNPYGMYQQQQIPTVQMISPIATTTLSPHQQGNSSSSGSSRIRSVVSSEDLSPDSRASSDNKQQIIEENGGAGGEDEQQSGDLTEKVTRESDEPEERMSQGNNNSGGGDYEGIVESLPIECDVSITVGETQEEEEEEEESNSSSSNNNEEQLDVSFSSVVAQEPTDKDNKVVERQEEKQHCDKTPERTEEAKESQAEDLTNLLMMMETELSKEPLEARDKDKLSDESSSMITDDNREGSVIRASSVASDATQQQQQQQQQPLTVDLTGMEELNLLESSYQSCYRYKHSISAPASPTTDRRHHHPGIFMSKSECGSREHLAAYSPDFDGPTLHEDEEDNFDEEDMELEDMPSPHTPMAPVDEHVRSHTPLSTISGVSGLRVRTDLSKPSSPGSVHSFMDDNDESQDEDSTSSREVEHNNKDSGGASSSFGRRSPGKVTSEALVGSGGKPEWTYSNYQSVITEHVSSFSSSIQQQQTSPQQPPLGEQIIGASKQQHNNLLNLSTSSSAELGDSVTTNNKVTTSNYQSKSLAHRQQSSSVELLNINEDAHAGPMNVFEFDGLQILVPSTFISESSQKAVSATSQQSLASSEGTTGTGNDEEVKSISMRADETMPPRGELSEQESNGCTESSAWQLYMGQETSRMSTSYDLMARESWGEESDNGSDNEIGGPLLDSRSLATHFTSSLFLDRDRKTPTKRMFKCAHCSEVFDCPKERRVHSTTAHKEAGPSSSRDSMEQSEVKDIKLLDGRVNVFEEIFVPGLHSLHQPLLHQLQPPQQMDKGDGEQKLDNLSIPPAIEVCCTICNQRFSSEKSLQIHHRRMHVTAEPAKRIRESAKCQICNQEFTSVMLFNAHLKIHPLECSQCGKYFYRKQNFKLHMKRHLGIKPFPCTVCDKAFLTKQKLEEHLNGHTGNAPVKCNLCNETFRRYSNLTQHKNRHHLNIKKKMKDYICHCGEVFHTKKKLAWHKETHDDKPKACTYCNERFIHMASLTRHMRRAHNRRFVPDAQRENENVECPICKCIYLRSSLAVHMRVHNGEKPYECQVCSKAFSTKWNLQLHKWTHAARSTKPFKCNQCSAAFYRHSDYTAHMNSHRNVRPYTCNYCGAQFIRKYNCLRHVKEHEENKAYTCDICNKTFHRSYYLKEHLRVHSGARPYSCHICGKSSSTKSNHNKHVRIHHAREPVNTEN